MRDMSHIGFPVFLRRHHLSEYKDNRITEHNGQHHPKNDSTGPGLHPSYQLLKQGLQPIQEQQTTQAEADGW